VALVDVILAKLENELAQHRIAPPLGILYVADALEKAGFSVRLVHDEGTSENIEQLVDLVGKEQPLYVGLSTMTGPSLMPTMEASVQIKRHHSSYVVWGGLHPTMLPEQTLESDFVDLVVIGEGEKTAVELAATLRKSGFDDHKLRGIRGIGFKSEKQIVITEPRGFIKNLDEIYPAWHLLDIKKYFYSNEYFFSYFGSHLPGDRIATIITSRGCPQRCAFCYNQLVNKQTFRAQSARRVIGDLEELKAQHDISSIVFEDDHFFTDRKRGLEIVRNVDMPWATTMRADYIVKWGDAFVKELSEHGCRELWIGAESGSQRMLDLMRKDITVDQIKKAAELCSKHGIRLIFGFMIGIPGETWEDVCQTMNLMDELEEVSHDVIVNSPAVYHPFPGTPLFDLAVEHGFEPPRSTEGWCKISMWDYKGDLPPYADEKIRLVAYYKRLACRRDWGNVSFSFPVRILGRLARLRWERRFFDLPVDYRIATLGWYMIHKMGLKRLARSLW
jgi:anaerobic magnesium-protoporphyrin IX monomethyl ester cyclase